jgi:rhamnosyltransferase
MKSENMLMKYGAMVIFYNPDDDAIKRISTYSDNFDEVLVVDNSEEDKANIAKELKLYKNCLYHKMNGNEGIAKALNYGFYSVLDSDYDFLLTMDQDSIYTEENIKRMKSYIESNIDIKVGIYSPNYSKMYFDRNKNDFVTAKSTMKMNEIKNVNFCMTSGSFVNVKALKKVLPLDDYFIGYVDHDLCYRLIENGYKLLRVGCSHFAQQIGGAVKNNPFNQIFRVIHHTEDRYYYMVRNNLFLQKRLKNSYKFKNECKIGLFRLIFNIIIGEDNKIKKFKACIAGYNDFKCNVMGKIERHPF